MFPRSIRQGAPFLPGEGIRNPHGDRVNPPYHIQERWGVNTQCAGAHPGDGVGSPRKPKSISTTLAQGGMEIGRAPMAWHTAPMTGIGTPGGPSRITHMSSFWMDRPSESRSTFTGREQSSPPSGKSHLKHITLGNSVTKAL